jgi:hypothetical protein
LEQKDLPLNKIDLLFSHAHLTDKFRAVVFGMSDLINILIDSGAFSAYNSGKEIKIEEYTDVCLKQYHGRVWQYIMLDKIANPKVSKENLSYMLDKGCLPMPVFVAGEDFSYVQELVKINEFICVGGGQAGTDSYSRHRYQKTFRASGCKAKIHALGFLRWPDIYQLPIFSGDSCAFSNGAMYGHLSIYDRRKGIRNLLSCINKKLEKHPRELFKELTVENRRYFANCNIDIEKGIRNNLFGSRAISVVSHGAVNSYLSFSDDAKKYYKRRVFLAVSTPSWLFSIIAIQGCKCGMYYNYPESVEHFTIMNNLYKAGSIDMCIDYARKLLCQR